MVSESSEFSAGLVAESLGLPLVRVHPGLARLHTWERLVGPTLSDIRGHLGLPPDPDARWLLDAPQISYFPDAFEPPTDSPAEVCRVRRPSNVDQASARTNTVYVTFGTEIPGMPMFAELARDAVHAAQHAGADVLLTVAHADPRQFDDLQGVRIASWVDQDTVLSTARAVICHAGAGTTLGALATGTPIIAIPLFADQPFNAEQIANTRTGVAVPPGPDLAAGLAQALDQVLTTEPPGCKPMADAIRSLPALADAIDMIKEVATGRARFSAAR